MQSLNLWLSCLHHKPSSCTGHTTIQVTFSEAWRRVYAPICVLQVLGCADLVLSHSVPHIWMGNKFPERAWRGRENSSVLVLIQHHVSKMSIDISGWVEQLITKINTVQTSTDCTFSGVWDRGYASPRNLEILVCQVSRALTRAEWDSQGYKATYHVSLHLLQTSHSRVLRSYTAAGVQCQLKAYQFRFRVVLATVTRFHGR